MMASGENRLTPTTMRRMPVLAQSGGCGYLCQLSNPEMADSAATVAMSDHPGVAWVAALAPIPVAFIPEVSFAVDAAATADSAVNVANGARLSQQLALESANSAFTATGELSEGAISGANEIIPAGQLGNPAIPQGLSKFATDTFASPSGPFQVHFYMNAVSGAVYYGLDYKVIFNSP
jgi:hypothetical protein